MEDSLVPVVSNKGFEYIRDIISQRFGCPDLRFSLAENLSVLVQMKDSSSFIRTAPFLNGFDLKTLFKTPCLKLHMLPADGFMQAIIGESAIPVLGPENMAQPEKLFFVEENAVHISFDLLGTFFYILTRMEEYTSPIRDHHGRFPASASHAFQNGYLHRPVVDEILEILWTCINHCWPGAQRKETFFRTVVSHDVDLPFAEAFSGPGRVLHYIAGDIIKRKEYTRAFKRIGNAVLVKRGDFRKDTNYTFDRIMDISEKHGLKSAFYFKTDCTNGKFDIPYPIQHPFLREMLRDIHNRGHEIGLHPSYETYRNPEQTRKEFEKLLQVCSEEGITQDKWGGRQHYLRWEAPTTWRNWNEAGLNYDSSLSYADCAGFRCGTCHDFPVFDVFQNSTLKLLERPLIVMEGTLFGENYMNLSYKKAIETTLVLKRHCRKFRGNFTLLWHNSSFQTKSMWEYYKTVLED
jgi:hypothetical protein